VPLAFHLGREAVPPLPQYAFMAWCSVRESTGTTSKYIMENTNFFTFANCSARDQNMAMSFGNSKHPPSFPAGECEEQLLSCNLGNSVHYSG